jgi:pSer/pThr/pTyr-binding forkhead associated (FHA) protein
MSAAQQTSALIKFKIDVLKGAHAGQVFAFDLAKSAFIGRGPENEICLSNDPRISRQHAEIKQISGQFYIVNLSQKNFILVNGETVDTELLEQNAIVQIGESEFKFSADFPNLTPTMTLPQNMRNEAVPAPMQRRTPVQKLEQKANSTPQNLAPPAARNTHRTLPPPKSPGSHSRLKFYAIIAAVGILGYVIFSGNKKETKVQRPFRGSPEIAGDLQASIDKTKALDTKLEDLKSPTFRRAQENYIKGFREYRQAHYARARDYFQIVLSLNPNHELAKRYYHLSLVKFDELVQANLNQGLKNRERKNYKLCQASMANVLIMIQNNKSHPQYAETNQYFQECSKAVEGQY